MLRICQKYLYFTKLFLGFTRFSFFLKFYRDLGSTRIGTLPGSLIHNNTELRHLRVEGNEIQYIPTDFFKYSQKLTSLIIDHNEIEWLESDIFHPLTSLTDIHLQHNKRFEMYCDYGFGDSTLFPHLRSIYMHQMSHKCIQPWINNLQQKRHDLNIHHQIENECPLIQIYDLPNLVQRNTSLFIQFDGPSIFINHRAYWISSEIDTCSDFRSLRNFNKNQTGHEEVEINNDGKMEFLFGTKGKYFLVYKYGDDSPYLPYKKYMIDVV